MSKTNDFEPLIHAAQTGEAGAFDQLVVRFYSLAFATALSAVNDFELARDAVQETFLEVHRALPSLREASAFPNWLRSITYRQTLRLLRFQVDELREEVLDSWRDGAPGPQEELERGEVRQQVLEALSQLPENQRIVLILFHLHEIDMAEIASFLDLPLTTVKKRLSDGRKKLKERMIAMIEETLGAETAQHEDRRVAEVVALVQAIARIDVSEVERLLKGRPGLAKTRLYDSDPRGQSVLQRAIPGDGAQCAAAHIEIVRLLLEQGADANAPDWDGRPQPPLMRAAWGGHAPIIELLLRHGADPEVGPDEGVFWWQGDRYRPIDAAAVHGHTAAVEALIRGGAHYTIADTVMAGLVELTRALLDEDSSRLQEVQVGQTPLHHALSWHFHAEILALLFERGANINAVNHLGYAALPWALNRGKPEAVLALLRQHGAAIDVFAAAGLPDLAALERLLGEDTRRANAALADGTTPIFFAVNANSTDALQRLLACGARPNVQGTDDWRGRAGQGTPLRLAARRGYRDMVQTLLEAGAQVDGQTIINAVNADLGTLEALLTQDARAINFADPSLGYSAMDWAILHNNTAAVQMLLRFGFDVNRVGPKEAQYSHAPLHFTAKFGQVEIAELLLAAGANVKIRDRLLQTPAQVAAANGQDGVLSLLEGRAGK